MMAEARPTIKQVVMGQVITDLQSSADWKEPTIPDLRTDFEEKPLEGRSQLAAGSFPGDVLLLSCGLPFSHAGLLSVPSTRQASGPLLGLFPLWPFLATVTKRALMSLAFHLKSSGH
jgi:hypothetical protein